MTNRKPDFEDERGTITDLLGAVDGVTEIFTFAGAVRGNHIHHQTTQWTYIRSGRLQMVQAGSDFREERVAVAGDLVCEPPGIPHAWKALEDSVVLVFTKGPRSGKDYESDVDRLDVPLLAKEVPA